MGCNFSVLAVDLCSEPPVTDGDKQETFRRRAAFFRFLSRRSCGLAGDCSYSAVKSTQGSESRGCFCPLPPVLAAAQPDGESI